jgi:hypothetical protein
MEDKYRLAGKMERERRRSERALTAGDTLRHGRRLDYGIYTITRYALSA